MGRMQPKFSDKEISDINEGLKNARNKNTYKRVMALKLKAVNKMKSKEIATIVELHEVTVNNLVGKFKKHGIDALLINNYKANRSYLKKDEEFELLKKLAESYEDAQNLTVDEIAAAFETSLGHPIGKSTVYKIMRRNQWDKIVSAVTKK